MTDVQALMKHADIADLVNAEGTLTSRSPIDGSELAKVKETPASEVNAIVARAVAAQKAWREIPAPRRGELIRIFGEELRKDKELLGNFITLEVGKIPQEAVGEVQEAIDMCDLAVGQSRQLFGLTIASERPGHRVQEVWHPLGVCGVITAFNFPVAVWAWNTTLALVCGNAVIWKPSEKALLTALACQRCLERALARFGDAPDGLHQIVVGERAVGQALVEHHDVALISATGSTAMGRQVAPRVAERFGRYLLELGGNNAMVVTPSADLDIAVRAIVFSAVGTSGQRCTTLRRLIAHEDVYAELKDRLVGAYNSVPIGSPTEDNVLMGPLIDGAAFERMQQALRRAAAEGGTVACGGERVLANRYPDAFYVKPAIVEMPQQTDTVCTETFAPILYALRYRELDDALRIHNSVPQGLSSCILSNDIRETERFISASGSDCGMANVNIGPSGAEIGGAFGGEKETGGGRESGSDAWKAYMRRATNTINYSRELPLAQGIRFEIG